MKNLFIFYIFLFVVFFLTQNAFACECAWKDSTMNKEKATKFYLNEFQGAVFSGEITNITEEIDDSTENSVFVIKLSILIQTNYFGDKKEKVTIYTTKYGCGISDFEKGKTYLFVTHKSNGQMSTIVCDYLFREFFSESEFKEIFSKTKSHKKIK